MYCSSGVTRSPIIKTIGNKVVNLSVIPKVRQQTVSFIAKGLKPNQIWRHNQAGDMPHFEGHIRLDLLKDLVQANSGRRGYTYTHHKLITHNVEAIKYSNKQGFTINS